MGVDAGSARNRKNGGMWWMINCLWLLLESNLRYKLKEILMDVKMYFSKGIYTNYKRKME